MNLTRLERVKNGVCLTTRQKGTSFCVLSLKEAFQKLNHRRYFNRGLISGPVGHGTVHVYSRRHWLPLNRLDLVLFTPIAVWFSLLGAGSVLQNTSPFMGGMVPIDAFMHFLQTGFVDLTGRATLSLVEASMLWLSLYGSLPIVIVGSSVSLAMFLLGHLPTLILRSLLGEIRETDS